MFSLLILAAAVSTPVPTHPIDGYKVDRPYTTFCPHTDPVSQKESDTCDTNNTQDKEYTYVFMAQICDNSKHLCIEAGIRPGAPQEEIDYATMISVTGVQFSHYPRKVCFPDEMWTLISPPLRTLLVSDPYKFAKTQVDQWCSPNEIGGRP